MVAIIVISQNVKISIKSKILHLSIFLKCVIFLDCIENHSLILFNLLLLKFGFSTEEGEKKKLHIQYFYEA